MSYAPPAVTSALARHRRPLVAVVLAAVAYLYVFPYQPTINNPNENSRLYMTASMVELGTYRLDEIRERWGWTNDCAAKDGHFYSVKAPGTSLLGVPAYAAYYWLGRSLGFALDRTTALWLVRVTATVLPALLFFFFFYRWLARRSAHGTLVDAVYLAVVLGSMLYAYGTMFVSHTQSAAVAFGAFMLLHRAREQGEISPARAFWAGLFTAAVTLFEYPGFVASLALSAFALVAIRPRKRLFFFALGGIIPALVMMHFQWKAFGSPFTPGHLYVENASLRAAHHEGLYGADGLHLDAAWKLLVHPYYGLFVLTPLLALAPVGLVRLLARRAERVSAAASLAVVVLTYLVICTMNNWHAGWSVGPRYLAVCVPFVAWWALEGLDAVAVRAPTAARAVALGTALASIVLSGVPSAWYPHPPPPPDFPWPLAELYAPLIAHGFAPYNALNLVGVYGTTSMLPLLALVALAIGWAAWQGPSPGRRLLALAVALPVAFAVVAPFAAPRERSPETERALAFVTSTWTPAGHDSAAVLAQALAATPTPDAADLWRLAELYREQGREAEARAAMHRAEARARRAP